MRTSSASAEVAGDVVNELAFAAVVDREGE